MKLDDKSLEYLRKKLAEQQEQARAKYLQNPFARCVVRELAKINQKWAKELQSEIVCMYLRDPEISDEQVEKRIESFRPKGLSDNSPEMAFFVRSEAQ